MTKKKITTLKDRPFGYKTSKELFDKIVTPNFNKLESATTIEEFYAFIFPAGALRDWIIGEYCLSQEEQRNKFYSNKDFIIFNSIYNNSKHYKLTAQADRVPEYNVVLDGTFLGSTRENGAVVWDDNEIWDDSAYCCEQITGEQGSIKFQCLIRDEHGGEENIFLFEICKNVYTLYENILASL